MADNSRHPDDFPYGDTPPPAHRDHLDDHMTYDDTPPPVRRDDHLDEPLDDFQTFRRPNYYASYYTNAYYHNHAAELMSAEPVYADLVNREYYRENWSTKTVGNWNENDTMGWVFEATTRMGLSDLDVTHYNFRISGKELIGLSEEEFYHKLAHPLVDRALSIRIARLLFEKLQALLQEEMAQHQQHGLRYPDGECYPDAVHSLTDLDGLNKTRHMEYVSSELLPGIRCPYEEYGSKPPSPEYTGSDASKSSDDDCKLKAKRPPGRPRGSGRKLTKRPKNVSIPEFLRDLLLDPQFCPSIIRWEVYDEGKFRFVKPDVVAKLWGDLKGNKSMTFEKFSRAMRYHYKQKVLESVPAARLVYKFGDKAPKYDTDNPNFINVKVEKISDHYDSEHQWYESPTFRESTKTQDRYTKCM